MPKILIVDDDLAKPCDVKELVAKVKAALGPEDSETRVKFWGTWCNSPIPNLTGG